MGQNPEPWNQTLTLSSQLCIVLALHLSNEQRNSGRRSGAHQIRQHKDLLLRRERSQTLERGLGSFPQLVSGHPSLLCVLNRLWPQQPKDEKQPQAHIWPQLENSLSFYPHRHLSVLSVLPSELRDAPEEPLNPLAVWCSASAGRRRKPENRKLVVSVVVQSHYRWTVPKLFRFGFWPDCFINSAISGVHTQRFSKS